eukprot:scaffold4481_cov121-Cylindrotheca_fusiformis.AAC.20
MKRRSAKRRRRRPPVHFHTSATATEERFFQKAIQNSQIDRTHQKELDVPWGPTFYPTVEEMQASPLEYIEKIRPMAQKYGICKIKPPKGWNPPPVCKCYIYRFYYLFLYCGALLEIRGSNAKSHVAWSSCFCVHRGANDWVCWVVWMLVGAGTTPE